jgi:DNA helicase II / ATP-dependent DNA helicase PcrA
VVGDDDQSIYVSTRYADPDGICNFADKQNAKAIPRMVCHRCSSNVIKAASQLIRGNKGHRVPKALTARPGALDGFARKFQFPTAEQEAAWLAHKVGRHLSLDRTVLVLLCNKSLGDFYMAEMDRQNVEYADLRVRDDQTAEDVHAVLMLCEDRQNGLALRRLLQDCVGLKAKQAALLRDIARANETSLWDATREGATGSRPWQLKTKRLLDGIERVAGLNSNRDMIKAGLALLTDLETNVQLDFMPDVDDELLSSDDLAEVLLWFTEYHEEQGLRANARRAKVMSMHGAKGRDADIVFIPALEDQLIPGTASEIEQRRLTYVSLTRARIGAYMTCACTRKRQSIRTAVPWQVAQRAKSRYMSETPGETRFMRYIRDANAP